MESCEEPENISGGQESSGANWHTLYAMLTVIVTGWVCSAHLALWMGQREDIIAEIVQEAIVKLLKRIRRGEMGEMPQVQSAASISVKIARNCFIDAIRRDQKVIPASHDASTEAQLGVAGDNEADYTEVALENVYSIALFRLVVAEIVLFPPKLRAAVLTDLANRMSFTGEVTLLQQAFREAGVDLEQYRCPVSGDHAARSRQAALASLAYKRIGKAVCIQEYM